MRVDYDAEQVRYADLPRRHSGRPRTVRVAVRVAGDPPDGSSTATDWLGKPRSFTDWVAQ